MNYEKINEILAEAQAQGYIVRVMWDGQVTVGRSKQKSGTDKKMQEWKRELWELQSEPRKENR